MNALWSYFWPLFAAGLVTGAIAGSFAFRLSRVAHSDALLGEQAILARSKRKRAIALVAGIAATLAAAALWHGPLGGADRFANRVERHARATLVHYEMPQIEAHLHRGPLTRRMELSGAADDFQRSELVRLTGELPGVSSSSWTASGGGIPLIAEGSAAAILGFLAGLLLAYLVQLRRRYNAEWKW